MANTDSKESILKLEEEYRLLAGLPLTEPLKYHIFNGSFGIGRTNLVRSVDDGIEEIFAISRGWSNEDYKKARERENYNFKKVLPHGKIGSITYTSKLDTTNIIVKTRLCVWDKSLEELNHEKKGIYTFYRKLFEFEDLKEGENILEIFTNYLSSHQQEIKEDKIRGKFIKLDNNSKILLKDTSKKIRDINVPLHLLNINFVNKSSGYFYGVYLTYGRIYFPIKSDQDKESIDRFGELLDKHTRNLEKIIHE